MALANYLALLCSQQDNRDEEIPEEHDAKLKDRYKNIVQKVLISDCF